MRYRTLAVGAAALLTFVGSASAQQTSEKLEVGKWSGKVTPPDGHTVNVIYDVAYAGDTLKITILAEGHGNFAVTEAKFESSKLSFKFVPGVEVVCVLDKKEANLAGSCTDEEGGVALIEMSPPKKESK